MADNHRPSKKKEDIDRARQARSHPSVAEEIVWELVRNSRLGFKFKREHPFGGYRLDFYCAEAKVALELDGEQHDPIYDSDRDRYLSEFDVLVIRIPNLELFGLDPEAPYRDHLKELMKLCEKRSGRPRF
ncbi:MAG: DUF559 domain-containing protein [Armatimonadota bacterium]